MSPPLHRAGMAEVPLKRLAPDAADQLRAHAERVAALAPPLPPLPDLRTPGLLAEAADGLAEVRASMWSAAVPSRFVHARIEGLPEPLASELHAWATAPTPTNVVLLGPVGVGKSWAACAACHARFMRMGAEVRFLPVVELLDQLRPGGPDRAFADLADTELLVVDDLGSERATDWTDERLYALVNRRWLEERPTVFTSNLDAVPPSPGAPSPLEVAVGERTFSRIVGNDALVAVVPGRDRRRRHAPQL